jgi:hypothetical protein
MIDEADRERAERWAWWVFAGTTSGPARESGCLDWWLSFEVPPERLSDSEADALMTRVFRRMQEYKAGADYKPSIEDFAEWIGLDLGGVFETIGKLTEVLVERAIEHGRG